MGKIKDNLQNYLVGLDLYLAHQAIAAELTQNNGSDSISEMTAQEMKVSRDHVVQLLNHYTNDESLSLDLRRFFRVRWAVIRKSRFAYVECPIHPLNQLCERVAIDIASTGESIATLLMPTIEVKHYALADASLIELTENADRSLAYHRFILSHDGKSVIPLQEWFDLQDGKANEAYLYHLYLTGPQGEHEPIAPEKYDGNYAKYYSQFVRTALHSKDLENLKTVSPSARVYIDEIQSGLEILNDKSSLSGAVKKLCDDCLANGVSSKKSDINGSATHAHPHPDVFPLIRQFLDKRWAPVSAEDKKTILNLSSGEKRFGDYLLVLRAGAGDRLTPEEDSKRRRDNLHTCVEVNANAIRRILTAHRNVFEGVEIKTTSLAELLHAVRVNQPTKARFNRERYEGRDALLQQNILVFDDCLKKAPIGNDLSKLKLYCRSGWQDECDGLMVTLDTAVAMKWALDKKKINLIPGFIKAGADLREKFGDLGETIFHLAALNGWTEIFEACLEKMTDPNMKINEGWTVLHYLARAGRKEMMEKLLLQGADIKLAKQDGWTALHLAVNNGHYDCVKLLLTYDDINNVLNHENRDGRTPLGLAVEYNDIPMLLLLINKGADLSHKYDANGLTVLHLSAVTDGWEAVFDACLEKCFDLDVQTDLGEAVIHFLARDGKTEMMAKLLQKQRVNINLPKSGEGTDGCTALHLAIQHKKNGIVDLLLARSDIKKSLSHQTTSGATPLHFAYKNADLPLLNRLIAIGGNLSDKVSPQHTFLLKPAVENFDPGFILSLVNAGVDLSEKINADEETIFHVAAMNGWDQIIDACLARGVDPNIQAKGGWTALHNLTRAGKHEAVTKLLDKGADVNFPKSDGWTALHLAVGNYRYDCVDRLLARPDIGK